MSKQLLLQIWISLACLLILLFVLRDNLFEPEYKRFLTKSLYVTAKERNVRGIKIKLTTQDRLKSADIKLTAFQFYIRLAFFGAVITFILHILVHNIIVNIVCLILFIFVIPKLILSFLINLRLSQFRDKLPNAMDAIIRGAKAGLTINDCIQLVANDAPEPIKSEFSLIVQNQRVGMTLSEAFENLAERIVTKETRLLSFVIQIQQQTGGNISEILNSLAAAIRAENAMKERATTVTSEGKVTAVVVSLLPIIAYNMINSQYPERMQLLFDTFVGNLILGFIIFWIACGIAAITFTVRVKI